MGKPKHICKQESCQKRASYGVEIKKAEYCATHKPSTAFNVFLKCLFSSCFKTSNFGLPGGKPTACKEHKSKDMVVVRGQKCAHAGCSKQPNFGIGRAIYCKEHSDGAPLMINRDRPLCLEPSCNLRATLGLTVIQLSSAKRMRHQLQNKSEDASVKSVTPSLFSVLREAAQCDA
jgi:hypothetical protein